MFVWIVSYPKSGNTWMRALLTNYVHDADEPPDLAKPLVGDSIQLSRHGFDEHTGLVSSELSCAELQVLRPRYNAVVMQAHEGTVFAKTHEAYQGSSGIPIVPPSSTGRAIYLIRNPLDIVASYAHHESTTCDRIIDRMADPSARILYSDPSFPEHLGTWSTHATGWTQQPALPVLIVRYEDLQLDPGAELTRVIEFTGQEPDPDRVDRAVGHASFSVLQKQERITGYVEGLTGTSSFFRQGQSGGWQTELTMSQADQIRQDHHVVMKKFGYS